MKNILSLALIFILFSACYTSPPTGHKRSTGSNILSERNEDGEYELIIIDSGYDRWLSRYAKPANYYSLAYYEQKNTFYANSWNEKVGRGAYFRDENYPFENRIDYDPTIDYGLELNYRLFTYFKYIEEVYGQRYNFPS
ncbi:DUF6146 family protein [Fulvivirga maritima]|uniref:DUF6146 family protein n=1 Tax=Fulvivirga maritima TaxID=2904247 RepID=UPI001F29547F|nr:DUF6146 family protein [Fulvivirga maritima]UII25218.1 DUF6146 family protein [Fulvivirga maritima]